MRNLNEGNNIVRSPAPPANRPRAPAQAPGSATQAQSSASAAPTYPISLSIPLPNQRRINIIRDSDTGVTQPHVPVNFDSHVYGDTAYDGGNKELERERIPPRSSQKNKKNY